jgi:glycosyltransferase involved in cell wall biosynthesis
MRILLICNELPPASYGGIGVFTANLATVLHQKGFEVTVAGMYNNITAFSYPFEVYQFKRISRLGIIGRILNPILFQLLLKRKLKKNKKLIDLTEYPDYEGYGFFHLLKTPHIVRLHNSAFFAYGKYFGFKWWHLSKSIPWILQYYSIKKATKVVAVANHTKQSVSEITGRNDISIIYNFIANNASTSEYSNIPVNPFILYAGSINRQKGVDILIDAFTKCNPVINNFLLVLCGRLNDDIIGNQIESLSPEVKNKIIVTGNLLHDDLMLIMQKASLLVFMSKNENLPLTWIEAMSLSKPIIVSSIPVSYEIIDNGKTGFIVSNSSEKLQELFNIVCKMSSHELMAIGKGAKQFVDNVFDTEHLVNTNIYLYKSVINVN